MSEFPINTALLTIGEGPIAKAAFDTLNTYSNLQGVIFSKRKKKVDRLQRVQEYGIWYTVQQLITQASNRLQRARITEKMLGEQGVEWTIWEATKDETPIIQWLLQKRVELVVVSGFQFILKARFFNQFPLCVNIHPSYLPLYKGPEPIAWGILDKKPMFGVTIHQVAEGIDEGDIVVQTAVSRPKIPLISTVEQRLAQQLPEMLVSLLAMSQDNSVSLTPQSESGFYLPAPTLTNRQARRQTQSFR